MSVINSLELIVKSAAERTGRAGTYDAEFGADLKEFFGDNSKLFYSARTEESAPYEHILRLPSSHTWTEEITHELTPEWYAIVWSIVGHYLIDVESALLELPRILNITAEDSNIVDLIDMVIGSKYKAREVPLKNIYVKNSICEHNELTSALIKEVEAAWDSEGTTFSDIPYGRVKILIEAYKDKYKVES